jgi:hypothetical protein
MKTLAAALVLMLAAAGPALAAAEPIPLPGNFRIQAPVKSLAELRFKNIVRQGYDVSCGAAALATILTHYYRKPVGEKELIDEIFSQSSDDDREKIRKYGFSMLELKRAAERRGYLVAGLRVPEIGKLTQLKVPAITLVNVRGYNHFVVVKGVVGGKVQVADPAFGNRARALQSFGDEWNGIILVLVSQTEKGDQAFAAHGVVRGRPGEVLPWLDLGLRPEIVRLPGEF